jgi:hypothetical protein
MAQIYDKLMAPYESSMPMDDIEGVEKVCSLKNYALTTNTFNLISLGLLPNCSITYLPEAFFPACISWALREESPYKELFNQK